MRLILASTSPRRKAILGLLGLPFQVIAPQFDETVMPHRGIKDEVCDFALGKARSIAAHHPRSIVIGSDTMISLEREKIGKPTGSEDARRILRALAGLEHRIFTAVAIVDGLGGAGLAALQEVRVKMRPLSDGDIEEYLARNESLDKAGAYSIQGHGRGLIESIDGDYLAAVGLPLKPIAEYLTSRALTLPVDIEKLYREKQFLNWSSFQ